MTMKVGLFVPCYVDALYPEAGVATYKLLKHYGLEVGYPEKQTCCGQPMANAGFQDKSEKVIETFDERFKDYDYIVAPSASCAAYVKVFSEGEKTEEYTVRLSDTPMDVIQQYCGQRDTMLCLKTSSQILNNDKTLGSQGVTADSVLEGRNRKVC